MNTVICERGDVASLVEIWCECFGEPPSVPTEFYSTVTCDVLVAREDGKAVGALNILPVRLGEYSGGYIFAAGVKKEFRGRGIFDGLLSAAEKHLAEKGADFVCLIPADVTLARTYVTRGYTEKVERYSPKNAPLRSGLEIYANSDFSDFATPDGESESGSVFQFGLLKPLSGNFAPTYPLKFAWFMGES